MEKILPKHCLLPFLRKQLTPAVLLLITVSLILTSPVLLQGQTPPKPPAGAGVSYGIVYCALPFTPTRPNPRCPSRVSSSCGYNVTIRTYSCNGTPLTPVAQLCVLYGGTCQTVEACLADRQARMNQCLLSHGVTCGQVLPVASGPFSLSGGGSGLSGAILTQLPDLTVKVSTLQGTVSGVPVSFTITDAPEGAAGQQVAPAQDIADCSGEVSATLTLGDKPGIYKVKATCPDCTNEVEFTATATGVEEEERILSKVSGDGQEGLINGILDQPLIVKVVDEEGEPVSGVGVNWMITGPAQAAGQAVHPESTPTGENGQAQTNVTLGNKVGPYTITATCPACTEGSPQVFTARAVWCEGLSVSVMDSVRPLETGEPTKTTVKVQVSKPAPADCGVKFDEPEPLPGSGGHGHHENRPAGSLSPSSCTIQAGSDSCNVQYSSADIAGEEQIRAMLEDTGEVADATVTIKVPGLEPMPSSGAGHWRLTGQTGSHPINHYGTPQTITRIGAMATDYFEATKTASGVGIAIGLNDMSLEWGGLFDKDNTWAAPHSLHRVGKSVDVDRANIDQAALDLIAMGWGLRRIPEPPRSNCPDCIHYESP